MSDKSTHDDVQLLRARVATLEQLLEVHEQSVAEQSDSLEAAIEQLRQHAEQLSRSEQQLLTHTTILHSILDSMADGVVVADEHGKFLIFNPAAERIMRIGPTDTTPQEWSRRYGVYLPDMVTAFPTNELPLLRAIRGEPVDDVEVFVRHETVPEGIWIIVTARPLRDKLGAARGGVCVFRETTERKRAERRLAAQHATTRVLAESVSLGEATPKLLQAICDSLGWEVGAIWRVDKRDNLLRCVETWHQPGTNVSGFENRTREITFSPGVGLPGRVWKSGQAAWIDDVTQDTNFPRAPFAAEAGLHGAFGFPILLKEEVVGIIEFFSREIRKPDDNLLRMMASIGIQIGQFIDRKNAEEQLLKLSRAVEQSANLVLISDPRGNLEYVNPKFSQVTGYAVSEVLGRNPRILKSGRTPPEEYKRLWETITSGRVWRGEFHNKKKSGDLYWASASISPVRNPHGEITHFVAVEEDITELKQAEQALRDSEALYHSLVESLPLNVFRKDLDGRLTFANSLYVKSLGRPLQELLGKSDHDLFPKELADKYRADDRRVTETGCLFETVEEHQTPRGERLFVQVLKCPVLDSKGTIVGTQVIFWDVTARKRAEQALQNSERRYRQFTEGSQDAIVVANQRGEITLFNAAAQKTFGYTEAEILGQPVTVLMPTEFQEAHRDGFARYLATREARVVGRTVELRGRRKNGEIFHLDLTLTALDLPEGVSFLAAIRDSTERHRMQARVMQSEKMASLGMMSAGVAHEINNPLGFVANNLAVLDRDIKGLKALLEAYEAANEAVQKTKPDVAQRIAHVAEEIDLSYLKQNLDRILDSTRQGVKRVADIVQNLRNFARVDRTAMDRVDIHDAIKTSLEMIRGRLSRRNITVEERFGQLPPVACSPAQLNQVFLNLLVNAMQAIEASRKPSGRIEITTRAADSQVIIEIADDGCGIPPEAVSKIFDPFFTTKKIGEGTGLGLSITHSIVRDHNGEIEVESTLDEGTRFRVILPINPKDKTP